MGRFLVSTFLLFISSFPALAINVTYSGGEKYTGEILFEDIGAFFVDNGELIIPKNIEIKQGIKIFIPFTEKSFSYLGDFNNDEDIVLPSNDIYEKDYALYNVYVSFPNKYTAYFLDSDTKKITRESLTVPYLKKSGSGKMIVRHEDNFFVLDFEIPNNPKEIVHIETKKDVPVISGYFHLQLMNEYLQLEDPSVDVNDTVISVRDNVSNYSQEFSVNRNTFSSYYYQNVLYTLNLDSNEVKKSDLPIPKQSAIFSNIREDISLTLFTKFKLFDLTLKAEEKEIISQVVDKAVEKTKEGSKGTLYFVLVFLGVFLIVGIFWYYQDEIKLVLYRTGKFTDSIVEASVKKQFKGILSYSGNDSFIADILKLQKVSSRNLDRESVDKVTSYLKGISNKIEENLDLREKLLEKKSIAEELLKKAQALSNGKEIEVRFSTVDFAYTISSCKSAISLLEEKVSAIDDVNKKYAEKFKLFSSRLTKFSLDVEMDLISESVDFDPLLQDNTDSKIVSDLFNLEKLDESLLKLQDFEEAIAQVIPEQDKNQILKIN